MGQASIEVNLQFLQTNEEYVSTEYTDHFGMQKR